MIRQAPAPKNTQHEEQNGQRQEGRISVARAIRFRAKKMPVFQIVLQILKDYI